MAADDQTSPTRDNKLIWLMPALLLCCAYGTLGLTFLQSQDHARLMSRCVLMDPNLSRIWSVAHLEIGIAYIGVFVGMAYYITRAGRLDPTHFRDLGLGFAYELGSFALDFTCVQLFHPFVALLIGDAVVMTFTLIVSRDLWFQRLLGVFVPLVFLTCALGHFMEGLSYWKQTYVANVPWTMVTADVGFAILVNAARFPAFIRGQDLQAEMNAIKAEAVARHGFYRDVLSSVTGGCLHLHSSATDLPARMSMIGDTLILTTRTVSAARHACLEAARELGYPEDRIDSLQTAVGEAAMNAVIHGNHGEAVITADNDRIQVWITDHGTGISLSDLPRATLEKGYSTKGSLGHGFWLMLRTADRVDLLTGATGTTVVVTVHKHHSTDQSGWPL